MLKKYGNTKTCFKKRNDFQSVLVVTGNGFGFYLFQTQIQLTGI